MKTKYIIPIFVASFFALSCKAQSPIIPMYNSPIDETNGSYRKDLDNDFDPFIGEWKWESGNNAIRLQFQKIVMYYNDKNQYFKYYSDYLIGEYLYVEAGVEEINYLPLYLIMEKIHIAIIFQVQLFLLQERENHHVMNVHKIHDL